MLGSTAAAVLTAFLAEIDRRLAQIGLKVIWNVQTKACNTLDLHVYKPADMRTTGKLARDESHAVLLGMDTESSEQGSSEAGAPPVKVEPAAAKAAPITISSDSGSDAAQVPLPHPTEGAPCARAHNLHRRTMGMGGGVKRL